MKVESGVTPLTSRLASSCARFAPLLRGCWRFPGLLAGAPHPPGSGRAVGNRASLRTRRLPRMRFAASTGMQRATGSSGRPGSWSVPTWRPAAVAQQLPAPRTWTAVDDRTSVRPVQSSECAQSDPMAAWHAFVQRGCRLRSLGIPWCNRTTLYFPPYLSTLTFALSTFFREA